MFPCVSLPSVDLPNLRRAACLLLGVLLGVLPATGRAQPPAGASGASGYRFEARWKPGGEGAWDSLTLDSQAHRLYVARTDCVQIVDTESGALIRSIPGVEGGHGVAVAADFNCGFATSGETNAVTTFNLTSLRPQGAPIAVGQKPGAILYEPISRHVFVFNAASNDVSVIDPAKYAVATTIPLGGAPASATSDGSGAVYVNLEDKGEVLTLDAQSNKIVHRWTVAPGAGPRGLVADPIKHRLFAACSNGRMIVLDAQTGKHLAELPIGQGADACAFDPGAGLTFASCGDGTLAVVQEDPAKPGEFRVLDTVKTQGSASALAIDPRTHAVYLAEDHSESELTSANSDRPSHAGTTPGGFALLKFTR